MSEVAQAAALGTGLGVITGLPLGVVNVAVAATAATGGRGPATRIGLGGAVADGIHAACAFSGLSLFVADRPSLSAGLSVGFGALLLVAAGASLRRGARDPATPVVPSRPFWFGLALTLPNPAALTAWVAVAGALAVSSIAAAIAAAIGVVLGSAGYFAALAALAARTGRSAAPPRRRRWLAAAALAAVGLIALTRGAWLLLG